MAEALLQLGLQTVVNAGAQSLLVAAVRGEVWEWYVVVVRG